MAHADNISWPCNLGLWPFSV